MSAPLTRAIATIRDSATGKEQAPPGIVVAVQTPDALLAAVDGARERAGARPDTPADLPMTIDTSHDIASVTKAIATTTAIMRLVDTGLLSLDLPVRSVLPSTALAASTTVRDLLLHRAGLWEWWPLYLEAHDRDEGFAVLDRLPLRYPPGAGRHYSDLGFMLLGRVVESVSGSGLAEAIAGLVLGPLGLSMTRYGHPLGADVAASSTGDAIEFRMVDTGVPYPVPFRARDFGGWRLEPIVGNVNDGNAFHALGGVSGHAGLFSTVGDLLTIGHALAAPPDDDRFVSAALRREFFAAGPDAGQALGFRRYRMPTASGDVDVIGHPGFTGVTVGWVPETGVSVVLATNRLHCAGAPLPNDRMWASALAGVGALADVWR